MRLVRPLLPYLVGRALLLVFGKRGVVVPVVPRLLLPRILASALKPGRVDQLFLAQLPQTLTMGHLLVLPHLTVLHVLALLGRPLRRFHDASLVPLQ